MGIFEDVLLNARAAVDTVGQKAGKVIDISKLRLAAADLKSEITQKYQVLGRLTFEEETTGKSYAENKKKIVENIKELKSHLESVNDLIASTKQKTKCDSCGFYNAKGAIFCSKCGEKLTGAEKEEDHMSPDDVIDFTEDNFEDDDLL